MPAKAIAEGNEASRKNAGKSWSCGSAFLGLAADIILTRGIRKWHGRLAHGFMSALVPRFENPTRNGLLI